jgi:TonB family protein
MTEAAANYRLFVLPWTASEADERRYRRVAGTVFGLFAILCVVIPLLPQRPQPIVVLPVEADRIVEFILHPPKPKPEVEVPPPKPVPVEKAVPQAQKPVAVARIQPRPDPRAKAASSGLLALSNELAELRDMDQDRNLNSAPLNAGVGDKTRVDRSILTAQVGQGSGGIAVARTSSGFGGGSAGLKGNSTARVASTVDTGAAGPEATRSGKSGKAARTREEVELVFDRNKSAIYALYSRALRDNPALKGKVVLEVTIAPSGDVTACRILSSELGDLELERKLVARVKMFKFEAKDVAVMTTTKPIEFFPA